MFLSRRFGFLRVPVMLMLALTVLGFLFVAIRENASSAQTPANWVSGGNGMTNNRWQPQETLLNVSNVGSITSRWTFGAGGAISATPTIYAGALYVPDWGGHLYKVDALTGAPIWTVSVAAYSGFSKGFSRSSPAIYHDTLILGTLLNTVQASTFGAQIMSVQQSDGALRWVTTVDSNPMSRISHSPVVVGNIVYVGVSSWEEGAYEVDPTYACCSFRGSVVALNASTGAVLWKTMMVPQGYSGGAVWSGGPAVDAVNGIVYVTTGNNYTVPASVKSCLQASPTSYTCTAKSDMFDSVVALNASTGAVIWARHYRPSDIYPLGSGEDLDFASGANLFTAVIGGVSRSLVGAGQKTGVYYALDAATGSLVWATTVGPSGAGNGIYWGTATNGQAIFVGAANGHHVAYTLKPSGQVVHGGAWTALNPATGAILWQTGDPLDGVDLGPPTIANGVLYTASQDDTGHVYALSAATGAILWSHPTGAPVTGGLSVANGKVYVGGGDHGSMINSLQPQVLYGFGLPG